MAKRENYGSERSPWRMVLYILAVVVLLVGIGYLVLCTREKKTAFQEEIQQLDANETEYIPLEREKKESTETETEVEKKTEKRQESETESESQSETNSESEETETESTAEKTLKKKHILLLNGSGKDGMAAIWKEKLEKAGYTKVSIASFPGASVERTRIFAAKEEEVPILQQLFTDAEERTEEFTAEITMEDGSAVPDDVEVYIVIGKQDAS